MSRGATVGPGSQATVPDLFEAQVERTPSAVAVVAADGVLTYAALDARAGQLAGALQALGVGPDAIVGVCIDRSLDLAVALLGVLKAGGACLPLDPSHPPDRIAFLLRDATPVVVVSSNDLASLLPIGTTVVRIGDQVAPPDRALPLTRALGPEHVGYVIYTSGSTGAPKGVLLTHGGLVNHHRAAVAMYGLGPGDRVLQFCSLGFDASIEELFPTWVAGATVVFRPDDTPLLGRSWLDWLADQAITVLNLPTSYWHEWVRDLKNLDARVPAALRLVVVGGEKALGAARRDWVEAGGGRARWVNAYGPTEATCMATTWEAPLGDSDDTSVGDLDPPIGRPLPNVTTIVVDLKGDPVAPGEAGELLIGGGQLARGYLRRTELTAERFVLDPVEGAAGRWYRTGDMVRERPDGELAFIGRVDDQVKIQGFRVETHEVEAALLSHLAVDDVVVVARDGRHGEQRLVAYVVIADRAADAVGLRRFTADRLPAHMVPSAFVALDRLPRNANGKVDRAALPSPEAVATADRSTARVSPRSPTETRVAAIWAAVLGIDLEAVSVEEDFFEMGGHSLLAMQVIAQVREEFGTVTTLLAMLEAPTIAALSARLETETRCGPATPPLEARDASALGASLPLSLAQEQMWGLELAADPPGLYNVTVLWRLPGPVDEQALRQALAFLVDRHEALRTSISVEGNQPVQTIHPSAVVRLEVTDLDGRADELQPRLALEDARPFVLQEAPLLRANLFHLDPTASELAVTFDHLVCDGTAAYVFLDELQAAYGAISAGRLPHLPPLELQPADFAVWQRRHVTDEVLRAQIEWWADALAQLPLGPAVPFDHVPDTPTRRIASRPVRVDADARRRLQDVARSTGSTVFVVAAAAVEATLGRWAGTTDVVLSTTLSGRGRPQLDALIGMFSGIGRIRADLSGDPPFTELVRRTRRFVFGMYEHQDVPFMHVRKAVFPDFPTDALGVTAALPVELQYFRTAREGRARGAAVVDRPGGERHEHDLFFRGQLHPLSLTLIDDGAELWGTFSFKLDFYNRGTVERLAVALEDVLDTVGRDPLLRLSALPVRTT